MAIAQKPLPGGYPRQAARPVRVRTRVPIDWSRAIQPGPIILSACVACLFYIWGWAQLTQANFQRVRLTQQISTLRAQNQLIAAELTRASSTDQVESWARAHGMVQFSGSVTVGAAQKGAEAR